MKEETQFKGKSFSDKPSFFQKKKKFEPSGGRFTHGKPSSGGGKGFRNKNQKKKGN